MPQVGRPRTTTRISARPPVNPIGIADPLNYGVSADPRTGALAPWRQFIDPVEFIPELAWPNSIQTFDRMRTDSQLAALMTALMWGITQLRFILDPNGARPSLVKEIAEDLNVPIKGKDDEPRGRLKRRFSHSKFVSQAMLATLYGHMFFEELGDIVDGKWRLRKLAARMPHTIAQINVEDDGGLVNIVQWAGRNTMGQYGSVADPIPVNRLAGFIFQQEGYNWHGRSMMRDCFKDWVIKDRLVRVEAINHERAGGVPYATAAMGATPVEIEDLHAMMQQFRIGESSGAALPFGTELKIAKGSGSDIDKTIQRLDQGQARRFMMMVANLAQGGQHVGSYALGDIFNDLWHIGQRAIAQWYCDTVDEHIIEDIADWNYGPDEERVPRLTWERTTEDSLGVEQLGLLVQRGIIIVDDEVENAVRYKYQLPKRTGERPDEVVGPGVPRQPPELPPGASTQDAGAAPSGAPSSESAPATKATLLSRFRRKPDVMATDGPTLVTVPNVEILHAGVEYSLSTGPTTFTPEDLMDAVMAANEDKSIPNPRLKIGHIDPRYNDATVFDGSPSFGKATNLRLSENGMAVYADYVGVPKWLADIMPTAFPSRSIEGYWNVESQMGKRWRFVLSACSLLGVQWPGVTVLEDLPQYYGSEMPADIQVVDPALVSATGGDPDVKIPFLKNGTAASANLDDVRRTFYGEFLPVNPDFKRLWIVQVLTDPNELTAEDHESGQVYTIPFSSDREGVVTFGEAEEVSLGIIPDTVEAKRAAASHVAAVLAIGRNCLASYPSREDSVLPTTATGGAMDPKEIRKRLGLPEDASDEQVQETLRALNTAVGVQTVQQVPAPEAAPAATTEQTTPATQEQTAPVTPAVVEEPAPTSVAASAALPPGTVLVDKAQWDATVAASTKAADFVSRQEQRDREGLVSAAMADGRIAPASKDHWVKLLGTDPNAAATLASLQPGLIPVEIREIGHGGGSEEVAASAQLTPDTVEGWTDALFPEVRSQRLRDRAAAAGELVQRSRVTADAAYRR